MIPPDENLPEPIRPEPGSLVPAMLEPEQVDRIALDRARQSLRLVSANLPHLSGLARLARLKVTRETSVAAVAASGLVLVNPDVYANIPLLDAAFVMAHELMHLALDTHGRQGNSDPLVVNFAHDYVINDMLNEELGREPPLGGLFIAGARNSSLEHLVGQFAKGQLTRNMVCWNPRAGGRRRQQGSGPSGYPMRRALQQAGLVPQDSIHTLDPASARGDVIPQDREDQFEPHIDPATRQRLREQVRRAAAKAASLGACASKWPKPVAMPRNRSGARP